MAKRARNDTLFLGQFKASAARKRFFNFASANSRPGVRVIKSSFGIEHLFLFYSPRCSSTVTVFGRTIIFTSRANSLPYDKYQTQF